MTYRIVIPDPKVGPRDYDLTVERWRPLHVRLFRRDTWAEHEVREIGSGALACSCQDTRFRGPERRPEPDGLCKHRRAVLAWLEEHPETTAMTTEMIEAPARALPNGLTSPAPGRMPQAGALSPLLAALLSGSLGELAKGLSAAIKACRQVEHDRRNQHHGYDYASAEAVIMEGRLALEAGGLALLPIEAALEGSEREGPDRFELRRTLLLVHSSGQCSPLRVTWPVVPGAGRPLDKATAAADTESLAYLLRDLLLMPRVAPGTQVNERDDRQQPQPAKAAARKTAAPKKAPPKTGAELDALMRELDSKWAKGGFCNGQPYRQGGLNVYVTAAGLEAGEGADVTRWSPPVVAAGAERLKAFPAAHASGEAAAEALGVEANDPDALERRVSARTGQAVEVLRREGKRPGKSDQGGAKGVAYLSYLKRRLAEAPKQSA